MKYIVILCDGMSDLPCEELGGLTPMEMAKKPNIDLLAERSLLGTISTVPEMLPPGSDVANLSILGYDPAEYYTGRSPFEAASIGVDMSVDDISLRVNLVTLSDEECFEDKTMLSYCANDIHTDKAREIIALVQNEYKNDHLKFYSGISYRHCLIKSDLKAGDEYNMNLVPPHDIIGKRIGDYLNETDLNRELIDIMRQSSTLLKGRQANCIWFWGEGRKSNLPSFKEKYGLNATMISAVDLLKGMGHMTKMNVVDIPTATGYIDTDFSAKTNAAIDALRGKNGCPSDLVYIHIEAPDECGHRGETDNKVKSIELIDRFVVSKLVAEFERENIKILITPDHPTPLCLKTHTSDPVPFLLYDSEDKDLKNNPPIKTFTEKTAKSTNFNVANGHQFMRFFITKSLI